MCTHTATESSYCLCDLINFALFVFPSIWNARSLDYQFFLFFHNVLHHKVRKVKDLSFWKKFRIFYGFGKSLIHLDILFYFSTKVPMVFWLFTKTRCLGKIWFLSYCPKTSRQIKMQDSLCYNISQTIGGMKLKFWMLVGCFRLVW